MRGNLFDSFHRSSLTANATPSSTLTSRLLQPSSFVEYYQQTRRESTCSDEAACTTATTTTTADCDTILTDSKRLRIITYHPHIHEFIITDTAFKALYQELFATSWSALWCWLCISFIVYSAVTSTQFQLPITLLLVNLLICSYIFLAYWKVYEESVFIIPNVGLTICRRTSILLWESVDEEWIEWHRVNSLFIHTAYSCFRPRNWLTLSVSLSEADKENYKRQQYANKLINESTDSSLPLPATIPQERLIILFRNTTPRLHMLVKIWQEMKQCMYDNHDYK